MAHHLLVRDGVAICTTEPRGTCGLEGYMTDREYQFQRRQFDQEWADQRRISQDYYRVWVNYEEHPLSYDTMGVGTFRRFFEEKG